MNRYLIVGVDPGTTTAVAAIDLRGKLAGVISSKDMGASSVVEYIVSLGRPSIIASDVGHHQGLPSKLSTRFGVRLFTPDKSLTVSEKQELTRGYELSDSHQRDALAAALNAYLRFKNKFQKIDSEKLDDKIKHHLLQGLSVSRAKKLTENRPEQKKVVKRETPISAYVSPQQKMIRDLEKRVKTMSGLISEKENEISLLQKQLRRERSKPRLQVKKDNVKSLESLHSKITSLSYAAELLEKLASSEIILVGVYPQRPNGYALIEHRPQNLIGVRTAFTSKTKIREYLLESGVEVYDFKELENTAGFYTIKKEKLDELRNRKPSLTKIISDYREKRE